MKNKLTRWDAVIGTLIIFSLIIPFMPPAGEVHAAVSDWHQGVSVVPKSNNDFGSDSFRQSMQNARATGANYVALVVPYYQDNIHSTSINPGWNTPTDASLISAIQYVHSLGLKVMLKPHVESYGGEWRAYINPSDRAAWFRSYGDRLSHLATISQNHGVELFSIGTELVSMAADNMHHTNTQNWIDLINRIRGVYSGPLIYGANSTHNDNSTFSNEKARIQFWPHLDYIGLSVYYSLNTNTNSVNELRGAWHHWNTTGIQQLAQQYGKPIIFSEIGYRSLQGARHDPWNHGRTGAVDLTEQANLYEALLSYWNDYSYVRGVFWWDWEVNPNAGGHGNWDYTPQNKPAQDAMTRWFTTGTPPQPEPQPPSGGTFTSNATVSNENPNVNQTVAVQASVTSANASSNVLVDVEVYDEANRKIFQDFYEGQSFSANQTRTYTVNVTPTQTGRHTVRIGVFTAGWSQNIHWNDAAKVFTVRGGSTPPSPEPEPQPVGNINIWWPTNEANVRGVQPFKAMIEGRNVESYEMFWQVDGDRLNGMYNSYEDYPHKEAWVDLSGWNWKGQGPYTINFVARQNSTTFASRSVNIYIR